MEDVLYLVHTVETFDNTKQYVNLDPSPLEDVDHQFPGVYFTLITKQNRHREPLYYPDNVLIFSKKLLEQKNWHINMNDYNGFINEENTFFSWQLDKAVEKINKMAASKKSYVGNEVVFHDPVPIKFLCLYIQNYNISEKLISDKPKPFEHSGLFLPTSEMYNDQEPDMSKIPFYCVPCEDNYTGSGKFKTSSREFYKKMAEMCGITVLKNDTRENIINNIEKKMNDLYTNRELLDLQKFI